MKLTERRSNHLLACASATTLCLALFATAPLRAQETTADDQETVAEETEEAADANEIVVTGTHISGVKPVGSEAVTMDREAILATGQTNAADVVRTLPQVRNLGEFREGGT